ncbi:MAG: hypothetical protein A2150_06865 [Candidatus Muproteobacteria bacterium RBG_16_64_11]|uniref:MerC domain-containing protein n=1 Tax=Candidatus Muproteobacteria bacterium RBG_16_64_11 TaxID=1817758 RepID=A0A1F6THH9_9PROT|nr:MAG: hypothetical protein A2150_06865 [Candidatus Muproteobacteria bacterium RBG_16_64_11]
MPTIEFIYDRDCPNVEGARAALRDALLALKRTPMWQEWDRADQRAPEYVRAYGSPTILVDGKDIAGMPPSGDDVQGRTSAASAGRAGAAASACRIYRNEQGNTRGIPDSQLILAALQEESRSGKPAGMMRTLSALPAVGGALLPKLTCAACWPAYTALLSALGVEFVDYTPYLLPVTVAALTIALFGLGWRARARRGFGPLALGIIASAVIVIGKFAFDSDTTAYIGAAALIGATVWNLWPHRAGAGNCGACCVVSTVSSK